MYIQSGIKRLLNYYCNEAFVPNNSHYTPAIATEKSR